MINDQLPEPNIPLLRKAVEWAEAEAAKPNPQERAWDQTEWATEGNCGTSFCIAGYAVMAAQPGASLGRTDEYGAIELLVDGESRGFGWGPIGRQVLGLTAEEADALFADENEIDDVRRIAENIAARAGERL